MNVTKTEEITVSQGVITARVEAKLAYPSSYQVFITRASTGRGINRLLLTLDDLDDLAAVVNELVTLTEKT